MSSRQIRHAAAPSEELRRCSRTRSMPSAKTASSPSPASPQAARYSRSTSPSCPPSRPAPASFCPGSGGGASDGCHAAGGLPERLIIGIAQAYLVLSAAGKAAPASGAASGILCRVGGESFCRLEPAGSIPMHVCFRRENSPNLAYTPCARQWRRPGAMLWRQRRRASTCRTGRNQPKVCSQ